MGGVSVFGIPSRYSADEVIDPNAFILREMKKPEKDRIKENLLSI